MDTAFTAALAVGALAIAALSMVVMTISVVASLCASWRGATGDVAFS